MTGVQSLADAGKKRHQEGEAEVHAAEYVFGPSIVVVLTSSTAQSSLLR